MESGDGLLSRLRPFLPRADKGRITAAVAEAERHTSGEIHVHVAAHVGGKDILAAARKRFALLRLHRTRHRNGVLILVAYRDRRFAILGDEGLHAKAGQDLWERGRAVLESAFAAGRYAEGIEACVREVGAELARHFPADGPGRNQLPNEVSGG